jgi:hypothetical protein
MTLRFHMERPEIAQGTVGSLSPLIGLAASKGGFRQPAPFPSTASLHVDPSTLRCS